MAALLDANVLFALLWPAHSHHKRAQRWFAAHARRGWATTPLTQAAFVRLASNSALTGVAVSPFEAAAILDANLGHPGHQFWSADFGLSEALRIVSAPILGYRQVTDAYLLATAARHRARLVTFDRGVSELVLDPAARARLIEVLEQPESK
ncbi:MAG: hypothetical protein A3G80_01995 [Betaproteobacteria bacterium RIFCSPLOWO2_12_FULL_62_13b]|nr:MAG: hypothetical protein A3G80_01995 [Betaproteobacteria bacterium RIFCSPLOWO2_12_FULL_62_13b]